MSETNNDFYKQDWPAHYYEIKDVNLREEILEEMLKENPDSSDDQKRLKILQKRYGRAHLKNRPDRFMHALLMIKEMQDIRLNTLNQRRKKAEFMQYADELLLSDQMDDILLAEYHDLLRQYIKVSHKSFSRPAFLGMGKRSNDKVWDVLKEDLDIILSEIPGKFRCQDQFDKLHSIAIEELADLKNRE